MDLATSFSNLSQANTMSKVQIAVAQKVMDNQKMQGAAALELLNAASSGLSKAGDELVAAATGLGSRLDTYG
ncbi:MAG: putative motility protein [Anaerolineae bacterium]|nr:putative motility protein [Phycisphaerae bacterium]